LIFGPVDAAIFTTRVEIGPGLVVTDAEAAEAIVFVVEESIGAGAVALKYAMSPDVVFTATEEATPPELLVVRVIVERPLENFALYPAVVAQGDLQRLSVIGTPDCPNPPMSASASWTFTEEPALTTVAEVGWVCPRAERVPVTRFPLVPVY